MSDAPPAYHLKLDALESGVAAGALRLLIADEAHEPAIRRIARAVLADLDAAPAEAPLALTLDGPRMKILHSAVRLLFNDLGRGQAEERDVLRGILKRLPDEHTMRAIEID